MKKYFDEKQKMLNAVIKFFDTEYPDGKALPEVLAVSVGELKAAVSDFHERAIRRQAQTVGDTNSKQELKDLLCTEIGGLSKMLRAHAAKVMDTALLGNANLYKSKLLNLKESTILYQSLELFRLADLHKEGLFKMGLTAEHLAQTGLHLEAFADQVVQTRTNVVAKGRLSRRMAELHYDAMGILRNQVDPLMNLLYGTYPDWVNTYRKTTKIIRYVGLRSQIKGNITDAGTAKGIKGASVMIAETGLLRKSRPGGDFRFRGLEPGIYTIAVSHGGFEPKELPGISVIPGQTTRISLELAKA